MLKTLFIRSFSGLVFISIMITSLLFHPIAYGLLMMLITSVMTLEYFRITLRSRQLLSQCLMMVTGALLFSLFWALMRYHIPEVWFLLLVFPMSTVWICLLYQKRVKNYAKAPHLFIPLLYITLPLTLTTLLAFDEWGHFNGKILLALFVILWSSDVGAYLFGMAFGQKKGHKLFPSLSPKKSWEGFFGGLLTALLAGFILYRVEWLPYPIVFTLFFSILLHIFGVWGDLVESQLKRHFQVKDSGKIMPGHGGLLDRFDSALLAFPVVITCIKLLKF